MKFVILFQKQVRGWFPGYIDPEVVDILLDDRDRRNLPKKTYKFPALTATALKMQKITDRPPTLEVVRHHKSFNITLQEVLKPGDDEKAIPRPLKLNIKRFRKTPEGELDVCDCQSESDAESDIKFEYNIPETEMIKNLVSHSTQYKDRDCPLPTPPPEPVKKKGKKKK